MNRRLALALFAALVLAQLAVPAQMIRRQQDTLAHGTVYRFRTAPVDPADPFRGRYVALNFEESRKVIAAGEADRFTRGQRAYAAISVGPGGYAQLRTPVNEAPAQGDYLKVRVQHANSGELWLELPFDRYYMDEKLAPEAERAYWDSNRQQGAERKEVETFAAVRVKGGHAALEELYLDGVPVREYLARAIQEKE